MLASSTWSAADARPPRPRPTSAKPTTSRKVLSARPELVSYSKNNDLEEEEEVVEDDDEDDDGAEFGDAAEREHKLRQQVNRQQPKQQRRHWSGKVTLSDAKFRSKPKFRPSSAPAGRPKSASTARSAQENDEKPKRSAASISIAYLRAAAEKKKARDREFARELFREESEFKKKISVKIDQANKMMTAISSAKSFGPAPDRDGIHMVKVMDPVGGDRVISVEIFLREFEQLATVPLGQTMQLHASPADNNSKLSKQPIASSTRIKSSSQRGSLAPRSRLGARPSSASRDSMPDVDGARSRAPKMKPADRSQVQEELRSVLEGTIELTKVLQEQLHELKLKGWNVAPRS